MDLISIILPAYNAEKYMSKTIESVLKQTFNNWELIIVNDGSSDKTDIICKTYADRDKRIKYFWKKNEGVSLARNYAIKKSRGSFIMFIDADDIIEDKMLEKMYKKMIEYNPDVVRCNYYINDNTIVDENIDEGLYDSKKIQEILIDKILNENMKCFVWLLLIRRSIIGEFERELHIYEDFCFYLNLFFNSSKIYIIKDSLYHYNKENDNSLSKKNVKENIKNMIYAKDYIFNILKKYNFYKEENIKKFSSRVFTNIINYIFLYQYNNGILPAIRLYKELDKNKDFKIIKQNYNGKYLSKKERIFNFCIRKHLYFVFYLMCIIKNKKRRKMRKNEKKS